MSDLSIARRSELFHNEDLLGLVFEYVHHHEMLSVVLTSQFFHSVCQRFGLTTNLTTSVKRFCHSIDGIQWILDCGCPACNIPILAATVADSEQGALDVLLYLRNEGIGFFDACPLSAVASRGFLRVIHILRTSEAAARNGHLEVLRWLRSQDPPCPWDVDTCTAAAENGYMRFYSSPYW